MKFPASKRLLASAVLTFSSVGFAAQPIDGFRGLRWGDPAASIPNARKAQSFAKGEKCYKRPDDKLAMGDAKLSGIRYCFYKDRFSSVMITFPSGRDGDAMKVVLTKAYGVPVRPNSYLSHHYQWRTSEAEATLEYRPEGGAFIAGSKTLLRERQDDYRARSKSGIASQ